MTSDLIDVIYHGWYGILKRTERMNGRGPQCHYDTYNYIFTSVFCSVLLLNQHFFQFSFFSSFSIFFGFFSFLVFFSSLVFSSTVNTYTLPSKMRCYSSNL